MAFLDWSPEQGLNGREPGWKKWSSFSLSGKERKEASDETVPHVDTHVVEGQRFCQERESLITQVLTCNSPNRHVHTPKKGLVVRCYRREGILVKLIKSNSSEA